MEISFVDSAPGFLQRMLGQVAGAEQLAAYERWWHSEGRGISAAVDRAGTPWLRMYDRFGERVDEILYPGGYRQMLLKGYAAGVVWQPFAADSLRPFFLTGHVAAFHDAGLYCPYTVSMATAAALAKYGSEQLRERFLPPLLRQDAGVWQGATWMTEIKGGSDLGANVETVARPAGDCWLLDGEKYFASNVGAELALVAARPQGAPGGVRGLALFLLPQRRQDGSLNYLVRRLKDKIGTRSVPTGEVDLRGSEAWLLGTAGEGIYLIMEVLNLSRVANSIGSVALAQRALAEARIFAADRRLFGRPLLEQPLMRRQFEQRLAGLCEAFALAWEAVVLLEEVWKERPPYSERYQLFRLLAHLAKYWTAEFSAQSSKWAMEVHGGMGVLAEYPVERWFREAMVLAIWEGPAHRQILDGFEVMRNKGAHRLLFRHLKSTAEPADLAAVAERVERALAAPGEEMEAGAEEVFAELARFAAKALLARYPGSEAG